MQIGLVLISTSADIMQNKHLEHPEDSVLRGRQSTRQAIKVLRDVNAKFSVKYDGAPAIVFGRNPENGKFFVGTKSVFNKVKIKINYTHNDIEVNHGNNQRVAAILHVCLDNLPQNVGYIWQGDFIGFGGTDTYKPNCVEYKFPNAIGESIVFAAHTYYTGKKMSELTANFGQFSYDTFNPKVRFLNTDATLISRRRRIHHLLNLAELLVPFLSNPSKKESDAAVIAVNKCIREGREFDCMNAVQSKVFGIITHVKTLLLNEMRFDEWIEPTIGNTESHEGYVMTGKFGTIKLVNRRLFSVTNFNSPKDWDRVTVGKSVHLAAQQRAHRAMITE